MMDRTARLFTLRLWVGVGEAGDSEWRGKVQALPEGDAYYFRSWPDLIERLRMMLEPATQAADRPQEEGEMGVPMTSAVEQTREVMTRYFNSAHGDVSMMADDVVFTVMATGQEHHGPEGVLGMLNYFYHLAFDATATTRTTLFGEANAMIEGDFVGKHIGEFAGIPATGKDVRVPLCVVYDIAGGKITHGRIYFEMPALLQQLGVGA